MKDIPNNSLRQKVIERRETSGGRKEAHEKASVKFGRRNSNLALVALACSTLASASGIQSALNATFTGGAGPQSVIIWMVLFTALLGVGAAISTGAQKTPWGSAERIKRHHDSAASYSRIFRVADRALSANVANDEDALKNLQKALEDVDRYLDEIHASEPEFPKGIQPEYRGELQKLNKLREAGLVDIHGDSSSGNLIGNLFHSKPKEVQILETWTGYGAQLEAWITRVIEDDAKKVRILLLDPESKYVESRAKALNREVEWVKTNIELDLENLRDIISRKGNENSKYRTNLEIRLYNAAPVLNMYRFDDTRIIGMYLWETDSTVGPQFEVKASDSSHRAFLADQFDKHFQELWREAETFKKWLKTKTDGQPLARNNRGTETSSEIRSAIPNARKEQRS